MLVWFVFRWCAVDLFGGWLVVFVVCDFVVVLTLILGLVCGWIWWCCAFRLLVLCD